MKTIFSSGNNMKFNTKQELLEYTSQIVGKTFKEIDSERLLDNENPKKQKGLLGHVVETGFFKYPRNSDSRADFEDLDIELKVTGYVKNKNGSFRAKERLVLSKIDYNKIIDETFETSHVLGKCQNILIIWYEYDKNKEAKDFLIKGYQLYNMGQDKEIFENDFEIIKGKVLEGRAHELSEGDTSYLGACTKARTSSDRTTQPFSDILSKPRAFSLKNAYMTGILREYIKTPRILNHTFTSKQDFKTVIDFVKNKFKPYFGKTQLEILEEGTGKTYGEKIPKHISKMISDEIIGKDDELPDKSDLFAKTNFVIKNLPIQKNGKPRERMSFKTISLSDFEENWEDSFWKNYFEETTIITICYQEVNQSRNGYRILKDIKKITFDDEDLDSFERTYNQIKKAIEEKDINLLPTSTNGFKNQLLEIAPKGIKGDDAYVNFFKRDKTKVTFMISKKLLQKKLKL